MYTFVLGWNSGRMIRRPGVNTCRVHAKFLCSFGLCVGQELDKILSTGDGREAEANGRADR